MPRLASAGLVLISVVGVALFSLLVALNKWALAGRHDSEVNQG
jgi:hypothetical protein